jgi:hypothetical protein
MGRNYGILKGGRCVVRGYQTHGLKMVGRGPVERPRGVPRGGQRLRWRLGILLPLRPAIKRTLPLGQSWEGTVGMRAGAQEWVDG